MTKIIVAAFVLGTTLLGCAFAHQKPTSSTVSDHDIQLFRKDLRSTQKQIIAASMPLNDAEGQKFWPMSEQYNADKLKINDDTPAVIETMLQTLKASLTIRLGRWSTSAPKPIR